MTETVPDLRYPIGRFTFPATVTLEIRGRWLEEIAAAPSRLRAATRNLDDRQLDTPYRPGGWTVREVTHHLFDSHANAYVRTKLALTESTPTIRPYDEARWAELPDYRAPIAESLELLELLHRRWIRVLESLAPDDYQRALIHPEHPAPMTLERLVALYAWHGAHHVAHITALARREGW